MRPISLAAEGFFAYRKPVKVDFADVDYFSLSGPTGSGKSSLIDAMVFALYGRVPRLGGATIAPAVTTGAERARVSFSFESRGVEYVATRLVQRTKMGGATTKEARLESPGLETVSGAAEVTQAVTDLLRLSFDDFTRTVVLPQGDFARFLQSPPGERQNLLRGLLGLDIYSRVRDAARLRQESAAAEASILGARLGDLTIPQADERLEALARRDAINELSESVPQMERVLAELSEAKKAADQRAKGLLDGLERLAAIEEPANLGRSVAMVEATEASIEELITRIDGLSEERQLIIDRLALATDARDLDRLESLYQRLDSVETDLASLDIESVRSKLAIAEEFAGQRSEELDRFKEELETARTEHAAHELASNLGPGDLCPVCKTPVEATLLVDDGDVEKARERVSQAEQAQREATRAIESIRERLHEDTVKREALVVKQLELLEDRGEDPIPHNEIAAMRAEYLDLTDSLREIDDRSERFRKELKGEEEALADLAEGQRSLINQLIAARDGVGDLKPDLPISDDPSIGWKEFLEWRDRRVEEIEGEIPQAEESLEKAVQMLADQEKTIALSLAELDIPMETPISAALARAQTKAASIVEGHEQAIARGEQLENELAAVAHTEKVAATLKGHLNANGFERWMMVGAIADLVHRANSVLAELSADGYSLMSDESGAFDIVDHRNADEVRPITTLSGGETFMVSLALALALAETLSAGGAGQLQSIFLDEGFGTLDDESIDVVAGVLEGLAENGLMVGIVTHVAELAARAPVRFKVRKGPEGSHIDGPLT